MSFLLRFSKQNYLKTRRQKANHIAQLLLGTIGLVSGSADSADRPVKTVLFDPSNAGKRQCEIIDDELIVKFSSSSSPNGMPATLGPLLQFLRQVGVVEASLIQIDTNHVLVRSKQLSASQVLKETTDRSTGGLDLLPSYVARSMQSPTATAPNDKGWGEQWGYDNIRQSVYGTFGTTGADVRALALWDELDSSTSMTPVVIGVLDSGIRHNNQDLKESLWHGAFEVDYLQFRKNEVRTSTVVCDESSYGFDALNQTCRKRSSASELPHGTYVAGVMAAARNNKIGIAGLAGANAIQSAQSFIKMLDLRMIDDRGIGSEAAAAQAINLAVKLKDNGENIRVLVASWGSRGASCTSGILKEAIEVAGKNQILFVAAAGNFGESNDKEDTQFIPASLRIENVISVGAINHKGEMAKFSNYGDNVHIYAPGFGIVTTAERNDFARFDGTSASASFVAAAAALLFFKCPQIAQVDKVRQHLVGTGVSLGSCSKCVRLNASDAYSRFKC